MLYDGDIDRVHQRLSEEYAYDERLASFFADTELNRKFKKELSAACEKHSAKWLIQFVDHLLFKIEDVEKYEQDNSLKLIEQCDPLILLEPNNSTSQNFFLKDGKFWKIGFQGKEASPVENLDGMHYIVFLLQRPKKDVSVQDLYRVAHPLPPEGAMTPLEAVAQELYEPGTVMIFKAREEKLLSKRLEKLQTRRESEVDMAKREEIEEEMEKFSRYREYASKQTSMASTHNQRNQASVRKAIDRACNKIREARLENLADHLAENISPSGNYSYTYKGDIRWKF